MDALRICDNTRVVFKKVDTASDEIPIAVYLSSLSDPRNRTVPISDIIILPHDDTLALLVMPMLLQFSALPFLRVGEFAEAVHQFLQVC